MKNQDFQNRRTEVWKSSNKITRVLPLGGKIKRLWFNIYGNIVISAGTTNGTARYSEAPHVGIIKQIRVRCTKAAGSSYPDGVIRSYFPQTLLRRDMYYRGKFLGDLLGNALTGAAATVAVNLAFVIHFAQPDMKRPIEFALNADENAYQNIQVEIDTGARDDTFSGSDRTWDLSGLAVDFWDDREAVTGDTYVVVETDHEVLIPGAQKRFEDKNLEQEGAALDMMLLTRNGLQSGSPVYIDTILNEVIMNGANGDFDWKATDLKQIAYDQKVGGGGLDVGQAQVGFYRLPFTRDGMVSKAVPLAGSQLRFDVSNPDGANVDSILVSTRRVLQPGVFNPIQAGAQGRY